MNEAPYFRSEMIFERIEGRPSCHGATVAELANGDIIAAWYAGAYETAKDVAIFGSALPKGGTEWSSPKILHDTPGLSDGNPVLFCDVRGRLWLFYVTIHGTKWTECRVYCKTSEDGGTTWSDARTLREDLEWMTRNKAVELESGLIILPIYNEIRFQPAFLVSYDRGASWNMRGEFLMVPGGGIQPSLIEKYSGALIALLRTGEAGGNIWTVGSNNGGNSWGNPVRAVLPNPNSAVDAVRLKSGAWVLVFNNSRFDRTPLSAALSRDEGETWSDIKDIENEPGEFSYPAIIQGMDGLIHLVYTHKRTRIKHVVFNEEWLNNEKEN
jgi:predicted neuraminidase